ncbi:MAG: FkbM family methyltransferase, partial [Pirellula sp.]
RLDEILDDYDWQNMRFGLLNVDTEGTELDVLQSNCWIRFRPLVISVEENDANSSQIEPILFDQKYKLLAECFGPSGFTVGRGLDRHSKRR